jgi:hypothetical protein
MGVYKGKNQKYMFLQILAISGNRWVTVMDHGVNIVKGYKGEEQRGWSYWMSTFCWLMERFLWVKFKFLEDEIKQGDHLIPRREGIAT